MFGIPKGFRSAGKTGWWSLYLSLYYLIVATIYIYTHTHIYIYIYIHIYIYIYIYIYCNTVLRIPVHSPTLRSQFFVPSGTST